MCEESKDFDILCLCKTLKVEEECTINDFEYDAVKNWCFDSK